jgi:hypothetical protein
MQPRVTLITLGVADLERARRFHRDGLGRRRSSAGGPVADPDGHPWELAHNRPGTWTRRAG